MLQRVAPLFEVVLTMQDTIPSAHGLDGLRAEQIGMAWRAVADDEVEPLAIELATRTAKDPELAREAVRSFRTEAGPPGIGWEAALHFERANQMWSQRRRETA